MSGIHINGRLYEVEGVIGKAKLGDVLAMADATKGQRKVSPKTINEALVRLPELLSIDGEATFDLLEDDELVADLVGLIFLTRRVAGDVITYDEALSTDFEGLKFDFDDEEPEPPKDEAATSAEPSNPT